MPQIKLAIGQMDLESDQSSRRDAVLAHLVNGYRVGNSIHMWPDRAEYCDLGEGVDAYNWVSVLHSAHYAVSNGKLFRIDGEGAFTEIAGTALTPGQVPTFTEDAYNVFVAADSPIYMITGNSAAAIAGGPVNVTHMAWITGFLVANGTDPVGGSVAGDFAFSDTQGADGIPTYAVWWYENNATKPDRLQGLIATVDDYLYAIGSESVDVSYISGDVNNPFAANKARAVPYGTPARHSIAYDQQSIYFLAVIAGNRQIVRLIGGAEPQIIGFPITVPVQDAESVDDARGFMMGFRGQTFYVVHFPTANVTIDDEYHGALTLAFSLRAQEWYILGEWSPDAGAYGAYVGNSFAYDQSTRFIAGNDGKIYTLASEVRADDPVMQHRWRNDGNLEWSIPRELSLGTIGNRRTPLKSRMCGRYYKRQDEIIFANGGTRMSIRTGWRNWGSNIIKINEQYTYDVKRGDTGVVFNEIEETFKATR